MKRNNQKRAFTIVELVIVIAVIAILAAVLIPTYSNLVKKANAANAQIEAKNLITEMLAEILTGKEGEADLLVFSQKGNDIYIYGYDASEGKIISYSDVPAPTDGKTFENYVGELLAKFEQDELIMKVNNLEADDWRSPEKTAEIVATLNTADNTIVYANYTVTGNFANKEAGVKPVAVTTGFSGSTVASYNTVAEAIANLGENKWVVVTGDYTLTKDLTIPAGVYLDVSGKLTIAEGVKLTVASDCNRLGVRNGGEVINNGTILVCGTDYLKGKFMALGTGKLSGNALTVPDGRFLAKNGSNWYAALANFTITYADGSSKQADKLTPENMKNAVRATLLHDLNNFSLTISSAANGFILDLGGYTLKGVENTENPVLTISASMTITNGTIKYNSNGGGALRSSGDVILDSTLTVEGGAGYGVWTEGYGHTLTVNGTVKSNGYYAITGNGAEVGGLIADCNIIVNSGAVISAPNGVGIYHPEKGTVTVNGGEISGKTGIQMCAGKLVVTGGNISGSGDDVADIGSGDGGILDGAAVSIINRNYPGGIPTAEISGGTFTATGTGKAVKKYNCNAGDVSINGGKFVEEGTDVTTSYVN